MIIVLSPIELIPSLTLASVTASNALVASSKISILHFFRIPRAIEILCFCPPDKLTPPPPKSELKPSDISSINDAPAFIDTIFISSFDAFVFPHFIFSSIDPENSIGF